MGTYYLDIETTGLNPDHDSIITIQYQELKRETGKPVGDLAILRSWESSEAEILNLLSSVTPIWDSYPFAFVPVGYNLKFEYRFLRARSHHYGLPVIDIISRPWMDLQGTGILMNRGEFKGSALDDITDKKRGGGFVPDWYNNGEYRKIDAYVRDEASAFIRFYMWLLETMPGVQKRWKAR